MYTGFCTHVQISMCVYTFVGIQVEEITIFMGRWYIYEVEVVFFGIECNAHSLFFVQY